jgi:hypothetical protein
LPKVADEIPVAAGKLADWARRGWVHSRRTPAQGLWILEAANLEEALAWGRKAVVACRAPVEVRAFLAMPD